MTHPSDSVERLTHFFEGKDLRPALVKAGYPQQFADWAHKVNPKYAGFVALNAFNEASLWKEAEVTADSIRDNIRLAEGRKAVITQMITLFKEQNKPRLALPPNKIDWEMSQKLLEEWSMLQTWFATPTVQVNPRRLEWDDAVAEMHRWHEELANSDDPTAAITLKDGQEVVHTFEDGWMWVDLNTRRNEEEAKEMKHCGACDTEDGRLYSLRDSEGYPYITAELNAPQSRAVQVYGRANSTPKPEYHRKILTLIGEMGIEGITTRSYGERSLSLDSIDPAELEWFEETYGYELTAGGASRQAVEDAISIINSALEDLSLDFLNVSMRDEEDEDNLGVEWHMDLELPKGSYDGNQGSNYGYNPNPEPRLRVHTICGLDAEEVSVGERHGENYVWAYGYIGSYNLEDGEYGGGHNNITGRSNFDNLEDWSEDIATSIREIQESGLEDLFSELSQAGIHTGLGTVKDTSFELEHVTGGTYRISATLNPDVVNQPDSTDPDNYRENWKALWNRTPWIEIKNAVEHHWEDIVTDAAFDHPENYDCEPSTDYGNVTDNLNIYPPLDIQPLDVTEQGIVVGCDIDWAESGYSIWEFDQIYSEIEANIGTLLSTGKFTPRWEEEEDEDEEV